MLQPEPGGQTSRHLAPTWKLFGLVELDSAGTVLYKRFESDNSAQFSGETDYTGRNFFTEVAPFINVVEFRYLLDNFSRGPQSTHCIDFTCVYEDGPLPVRVLLTRIRECSQTHVTKSILIHIRRAK